MSGPKPFKISDLSAMSKQDLTQNDLFLVSDADDPRANAHYVSKKVDYGTLSGVLAVDVGKSDEVKEEVREGVKGELQNNIETYAPIQTWYKAGAKDAPEDIEAEEDEFILSCGQSI